MTTAQGRGTIALCAAAPKMVEILRLVVACDQWDRGLARIRKAARAGVPIEGQPKPAPLPPGRKQVSAALGEAAKLLRRIDAARRTDARKATT